MQIVPSRLPLGSGLCLSKLNSFYIITEAWHNSSETGGKNTLAQLPAPGSGNQSATVNRSVTMVAGSVNQGFPQHLPISVTCRHLPWVMLDTAFEPARTINPSVN